jgi:nitrogen regulatory protein PII 2
MKELIAIIRPGLWLKTKKALHEEGFTSYSTLRVYGRGRQRGLRYLSKQGSTIGMQFIPKRLIWLWVAEGDAARAVSVLTKTNQTGNIGDGKIFVCPVEDLMRARTGETGMLAAR